MDFIDWEEVEYRFDLYDNDVDEDEKDDDTTPLAIVILPERRHQYEAFLHNLQKLSLSHASLEGSWDRLIDAFNLRHVTELQLLKCNFASHLLLYMARTNVALHATQVELALPLAAFVGWEDDVDKVDFLAPFHSLEDLFLMFDTNYANECYVEMILRHQETLRRLVYHKRHYCLDPKAPYWKEYCDSSYYKNEGGLFAEVLRKTKLESAGVCEEPSKLQKSFQSIASGVDSLKLLHLRFTGKAERKPKFFKEFEDYSSGENWLEDEEQKLEAFADWAFGPDGFPRLQVLASGDFSYGNRFADAHALWCRETGASRGKRTWRAVTESDFAANELVDANMDMMSACPVSPLFYQYGTGEEFPGIS